MSATTETETKNFTRTLRPGSIDGMSIFCAVKYADGRLSISGVEGPLRSGNCRGSCGQIAMGYARRDPAKNDPRYPDPKHPDDIKFAPGWTADLWLDFLDIWNKWHLNDMRSACEHQRALGWTYDAHHDPQTCKGELCPVCGYSIGSAWLREDVPADVLQWLRDLPEADRTPAWI